MDSGEPQARKRGRPRAVGADEKVLDAALEEYGERGWSGFTMDGVARRAKVGKSTVYLRWADKDALMTEAVTSRAKQLATTDTGSLRGDLESLVRRVLDHFRSPAGWATIRVIFDAASSPSRLGAFTDSVTEAHLLNVAQICDRAVARGELSADTDAGVLSELVFGATMVHALTERLDARTDTDEDLDEHAALVTDLVVAGIND